MNSIYQSNIRQHWNRDCRDNDDPNDPAPYQVPTDIGRNGSFSAFRILEQDVEGFENYLQSQKDKIDPELLAAKFCGRWRNGKPLELSPESPGTPMGIGEINNFNYKFSNIRIQRIQKTKCFNKNNRTYFHRLFLKSIFLLI